MNTGTVNVRAFDKGDLARVAEYFSHPRISGPRGLHHDLRLTHELVDPPAPT